MQFNVSESVGRQVAMTVLKVKKNSPTILFGSGIVLGIATVVSASRATLKIEAVLDEHQKSSETIKELEHSDYSDRDRKQDMTKLYIRTSTKLGRLYAPSVVLGVASVACLTKSHRILTSRNAALTAAYAAVEKSFKEYRQRVSDELGVEKDLEFRYGTENVVVTVEDKNGPKKKTLKLAGEGKHSMYARVFDEFNQNWNQHAEYNIAFLRLQQNYANDRLRARGHLFLNEVYDLLGLDHTPAGSQVGWLWNRGTGDDYVDFGIWTDKSMEGTINFLNGWEKAIVLDFNVDGIIWDKI